MSNERDALAKLCAEYRSKLQDKVRRGIEIVYVGPVDDLPGGAQQHAIASGFLVVKARMRSRVVKDMLEVCVGIGKPEGRKMEPGMAAALIAGTLGQAEQRRATLGGKG